MRLIDADEFEKRIKPYDTEDNIDKALYNFAHYHLITTPSAQPTQSNDSNTLNALDCISRQAAIELIESEYKQWGDEYGITDVLKDLDDMPSAQPEKSIMTVTVKPDELVGFAEWVLDEIWDEELWEYNWQGFPELVCRKLLKLGYVTTNEEGNYERNE